jgi:hypothetical protein
MRLRSTLLLLLLAAAVGVAIYQLERTVPATADLEAREWKPFSFTADQVDEILIESDQQAIRLSVSEMFWRIGDPVNDVADPSRVAALIKAVSEAEWLEKINPDDLGDAAWKRTGLAEPKHRILFRGAGITLAECWTGTESVIEGACHISVPSLKTGERTHYIARTGITALLKTAPEQWRDNMLLTLPTESISLIGLQNGHGLIELKRDKPKAPWALTKPLLTRGHDERVNELLTTLMSLQITQASAGSVTAAAVPAESLRISIQTPGAATPLEVTLQTPEENEKTKTTATTSHRKGAFTITSERLPLLWAKLNDLRDDHLARVDPERVSAVVVDSELSSRAALHRAGDYWVLHRHGAWVPANGGRVMRLFEAMNEHKVLEFASDSAANLEQFGLAQPYLTLGWLEQPEGAADAPPVIPAAPPAVSAMPRQLLFGSNSEGRWFSKYADEPFIYRVPGEVLNEIPRDSARWKSLHPARFTQFALRQISIALGTQPAVVLDYDPTLATWTGNVAGRSITDIIDRVKADSMAGKLAGLEVQDWLQDRTNAAKALQTPAITVRVLLLVDPLQPQGATRSIEYNFSPTQPGADTPIYYGRLNADPDVFIIMRDQLRAVLASVLKLDPGNVGK